jgi:transcription initiation factor IIF auxiliary subunit
LIVARSGSSLKVVLAVAWSVVVFATPIFFSANVKAQTSASLDVQNIAVQVGEGQWKWTAFVTGPAEQIGKIRCVRYTLHPTFPNPVQEICDISDPEHPFALTAVGWGRFNVRALIEFKDGSSTELAHFLTF